MNRKKERRMKEEVLLFGKENGEDSLTERGRVVLHGGLFRLFLGLHRSHGKMKTKKRKFERGKGKEEKEERKENGKNEKEGRKETSKLVRKTQMEHHVLREWCKWRERSNDRRIWSSEGD